MYFPIVLHWRRILSNSGFTYINKPYFGMDIFSKKSLRASRGLTYIYYTSPGDKVSPVFVFQHGWPDSAAMWAEVAGSLRSTKYPIIIPDMLGNDGTDKPTDPAAYKWGVMTNDVFEIIDAEDYHQVIIIGHDWGSIAASAMYHYHPKRVVGLVNLSVAYQAPSREPFDLEQMNQMTQEVLGYRLCEYWNFFAAEGSSELLVNNLDRLFDLIHGPAENMKHYFTIPGAMREAQQNNVVSVLQITLINGFLVSHKRG